jgi:hypothetical protein
MVRFHQCPFMSRKEELILEIAGIIGICLLAVAVIVFLEYSAVLFVLQIYGGHIGP